jgi:putative ATP-dependent endonuclease of OLD family
LTFQGFRGVQRGTVLLDGHSLLAGPNSIGKSTVCEALDLILGPERMFRRPIVDEYDFYAADYRPVDGVAPEIRLEAVLTGLTEEAQRRFGPHLRRWSPETNDFADATADAITQTDTGQWCLPVVFLGRFNPDEDDFEGGTFFAHPHMALNEWDQDDPALGAGLKPFTREDKRHCGFLYLRPNRTGSRALTFQRGSLLDTIVDLESTSGEPLWQQVLDDLAGMLITREDSEFGRIQAQLRARVTKFVSLADGAQAADIRASELTREHAREVLRLFIATSPGGHAVPFNRLSTGTLNQLVFALLTYIADLKGDKAVIFAIEEPEIALPPHGQRRLVDFAMKHMGQVIVTSHSPYVIEKFDPARIIVLNRDGAGDLTSSHVALPPDFSIKRYLVHRRQFAEAVLARAVLMVEGPTEAVVFPAIADVLDNDPTVTDYLHIDLAGITVFPTENDVSVPVFAPIFKSLGKPVYGIHDTPTKGELKPEIEAKTCDFDKYVVIPYTGIEKLLAAEIPEPVLRRFLEAMRDRADYPAGRGKIADGDNEERIRSLTFDVLKANKGANGGWAVHLIAQCHSRAELPATLADFLLEIDQDLRGGKPTTAPGADGGVPDGD